MASHTEHSHRAVASGAPVIGGDSRDLETPDAHRHPGVLLGRVPADRVKVFERRDSRGTWRAEDAGANAVLVGEVLMRAPGAGAHQGAAGRMSACSPPPDAGGLRRLRGTVRPEVRIPALRSWAAWRSVRADSAFQRDFRAILADFVGRPTPLTYAARLSERLGYRPAEA